MNAVLLCLGMGFLLAILFGLIALIRYLNYRQAIALAENGLTPPERKTNQPLLRWGIVLTSLGLALTLGLYFAGFANLISPYPSTTYSAMENLNRKDYEHLLIEFP